MSSSRARGAGLEVALPVLKIAFALLRYLAQIEQDSGQIFDRAWMLDAYAECLETVRGNRASTRQPVQTETFPGMARTRKAARHG